MDRHRSRASSADLGWRCTESLFGNDDTRITTVHPETDQGSAFHKWAETIDQPGGMSIDELSRRYGSDHDELDRLCVYARIAWGELRKWFEVDHARIEVPLSTSAPVDQIGVIDFTGTVDRLVANGPEVYILDWKTGRLEGMNEHQQRMYALLVFADNEDVQIVHSVLCYVRLGFWECTTYTREEIADWFDDYRRRLANGKGRFQPGPHCGFCPRLRTCPGAKTYSISCLNAIQRYEDDEFPEVTEENKAQLGPLLLDQYRMGNFIEKLITDHKDALRAKIKEIGAIKDGKGKKLDLTITERKTVDARTGIPILRQFLSENEVAQSCTISLRKCLDHYAERGTHPTKKAARDELRGILSRQGAVKVRTIESMRVVKDA